MQAGNVVQNSVDDAGGASVDVSEHSQLSNSPSCTLISARDVLLVPVKFCELLSVISLPAVIFIYAVIGKETKQSARPMMVSTSQRAPCDICKRGKKGIQVRTKPHEVYRHDQACYENVALLFENSPDRQHIHHVFYASLRCAGMSE